MFKGKYIKYKTKYINLKRNIRNKEVISNTKMKGGVNRRGTLDVPKILWSKRSSYTY